MEKLGSEFIDDFEKEETGKLRLILLIFSVITSILVVTIVVFLKLPDRISIIYMFLIGIPGIFFGVNADKNLRLRDKIYFFFLEKRRIYQTDIENEKKGEDN